jgi:hypothetical protein
MYLSIFLFLFEGFVAAITSQDNDLFVVPGFPDEFGVDVAATSAFLGVAAPAFYAAAVPDQVFYFSYQYASCHKSTIIYPFWKGTSK